jgi:hypothetical protein
MEDSRSPEATTTTTTATTTTATTTTTTTTPMATITTPILPQGLEATQFPSTPRTSQP